MFLEFKLAVTHSLHFFVYKQNCALLCSCTYMCVCVCVRMRGLSLCAHTQGTRVLLISAWAWERPLKVSLKWWMRRSEWALVFNRSHLRNSTTSTSNDFLSSAVRDAESQMWTLPPLLVSFALQFFSVIEMNARHPSHFAVKYTVSAATASSPLARWSERHWLSCYDGTWREIRCTMKPLNTQKISPRLWVTLIWAVEMWFILLLFIVFVLRSSRLLALGLE